MKRRIIKIVIFISVFLLLISIVVTTGLYVYYKNKILPGVTFEGRDLSGRTLEEANRIIEDLVREKLERRVTLVHGDRRWCSTYRLLGIEPQIEKTGHKAFSWGKEGTLEERFKNFLNTFIEGHTVYLEYNINLDKLERNTRDFFLTLENEPRNASYSIKDNSVFINPSRMGKKVPKLLLADRIKTAFKNSSGTVEVPVISIVPEITTEDIKEMKITGILGRYDTFFNKNNESRTHNIKLAAKELDGMEIPPEATFSFNSAVGPRTPERGYKEATIIQNNEFQPGLGGGVCQVSSTLYVAALNSGLDIVERRNHSLKVDYIPLGLDATVTYGLIDLKFYNNTSGYIVIKTAVEENKLTIKIFGNHREKSEVFLSRSIVNIEPPLKIIRDESLPKGEKRVVSNGRNGYRVQAFRKFIKNGEVVKREKVSTDYYPPLPRIVRVGNN